MNAKSLLLFTLLACLSGCAAHESYLEKGQGYAPKASNSPIKVVPEEWVKENNAEVIGEVTVEEVLGIESLKAEARKLGADAITVPHEVQIIGGWGKRSYAIKFKK